MSGKLILVVGPSGSGKGTLIAHIRPLFTELAFPKSSTTRAMRPGEEQGHPYYFLSGEEFQRHVDSEDFLEWAEYGGNRYGTLMSEVASLLAAGKFGLKELEVQGARQILARLLKEQVAIVFIDAGPWEEMERRIRDRAPIPEHELLKRKERYQDELSFKQGADIVISNRNGELDQAKEDFERAVRSFIG